MTKPGSEVRMHADSLRDFWTPLLPGASTARDPVLGRRAAPAEPS